jgi:signal transduction histidine kinase
MVTNRAIDTLLGDASRQDDKPMGTPASEPFRLLVVDADEATRADVRRALAESGLALVCDETGAGTDAAERLRKTRYDGVIVGSTPDLPTAALISAARADGVTAAFVAIVEADDAPTEQALADAGATDVVARDELTASRLARRLRFAVRVARSQAESRGALVDAVNAARAHDEVLAVVSHDLRGPLNAIGLAADALREEATTDDAKRYLGAIERASTRAERLIKDLLEAIKIENGSFEIAPRPIDARALVEQARTDHELLVKETGGRIETRLPDHPVTVNADRDRVLQVLANLIGNALKHAKGAAIALTLAERNGHAVFSITDQGPGIPPEELPHVFDRYWQGRKRKRNGAGLGLAIAKGIVEAHRGTIAVDSKPGRTQFEFTLARSPT